MGRQSRREIWVRIQDGWPGLSRRATCPLPVAHQPFFLQLWLALLDAATHMAISLTRERKLNTNFFFSNFSGTSGISRQNPGISRPKSLISLVSRDIPNFSAPTPSRGRPPPHPKISGPKSLGLGSFFLPDLLLSPKSLPN